MESMKNKVAMITGATSGIGQEAALLFAKQGLKIAAIGQNEEAGKLLVEEIKDAKGEAVFIKTNVSVASSVASSVQQIKNYFGNIHYAFNNAGIEGSLDLLTKLEESNWDSVINTNLKGIWLCLKYQLPEIQLSGGGAIVNVSTNLTRLGFPGTGAYSASKAGVEALTQVAAIEWGKYGIRVNAINPGAVDTPMLKRIYSSEELQQLNDSNPLKNIATAKEIAQVALWLCCSMSSHVNGATIVADGGSSLL